MGCGKTAELGVKYRWVQVFENKGDVMGCSNPHPHGQIWASDFLPNEPAKEERQQAAYLQKHGVTLLGDYLEREVAGREPRRGGERGVGRAGSLLGDLALRDVAAAAPGGEASCRS